MKKWNTAKCFQIVVHIENVEKQSLTVSANLYKIN